MPSARRAHAQFEIAGDQIAAIATLTRRPRNATDRRE
jgi:hypothetical protein